MFPARLSAPRARQFQCTGFIVRRCVAFWRLTRRRGHGPPTRSRCLSSFAPAEPMPPLPMLLAHSLAPPRLDRRDAACMLPVCMLPAAAAVWRRGHGPPTLSRCLFFSAPAEPMPPPALISRFRLAHSRPPALIAGMQRACCYASRDSSSAESTFGDDEHDRIMAHNFATYY